MGGFQNWPRCCWWEENLYSCWESNREISVIQSLYRLSYLVTCPWRNGLGILSIFFLYSGIMSSKFSPLESEATRLNMINWSCRRSITFYCRFLLLFILQLGTKFRAIPGYKVHTFYRHDLLIVLSSTKLPHALQHFFLYCFNIPYPALNLTV